jgi:hypothetical protein
MLRKKIIISFGVLLSISCIAVSALAFYLCTNRNAFTTPIEVYLDEQTPNLFIIEPMNTEVNQTLIIKSKPKRKLNKHNKIQSKSSRKIQKKLVCGESKELQQGAGSFRQCEYI